MPILYNPAPVASSTVSGYMTSADKSKLDGIASEANKYILPTAANNILGGIQVGYTTSNQNYAVQVDSNGNAYVSVPWTDHYDWSNITNKPETFLPTIGSTATTAAAGNHTHTLSMATDSGTNAITLAASTKYKLTAGGSTYIFTTPPNTTYTFTDKNVTLAWGTKSTIATIGGTDIHVTMPVNPNTDHYAWSDITSKPSYYDAKAIKGITRSGTTFTYTCMDGTTGTFTQQDNNTTYSNATTSAAGLMSSSDKTKLNGIATGATKVTVSNSVTDSSTSNALSAAKGKELYNMIASTAFPIQHGTDQGGSVNFNSMLTAGIYSFSTNAMVSGSSNKPCSSAGRLCVWAMGNSTFVGNEYNYGGQIFFDIYNHIYSRFIETGNNQIKFGDWYTIDMTKN